MNTQHSSLYCIPEGQPPPASAHFRPSLAELQKAPLPTRGKTTSHPVEFLHQIILSTKSNTIGQHTRHTCLIKPRRYSPRHHSSHQPNPLQHKGPSHHCASDETCTRCNLIPVAPPTFLTPPPDPKVYTPTSYHSRYSFV